MSKEMLINVTEGEECRIAVVADGQLDELYMERTSSESHVGNIYKGRVTNVEPAIQAAFVDFGLDRNGFLHISDLHPSYFRSVESRSDKEDVGRKTGRRDRPPIQDCLKRGQEVLVQILKEGIGTKGPSLTTYLSLPGRYLVLMPGMSKTGVSRKIEDEETRRKLRQQLEQLRPPENMGFIIRTAGLDRSRADLQRDMDYLVRLWKNIERDIRTRRSPCELYQESDLVIRTIRDVYSDDITRIICDNEAVARKAAEFLAIAQPDSPPRVELYRSPVPLFHKYHIEKEIDSVHSRVVKLPGGGTLVIDQAEALVAIDVNSGKFRDPDNAEQTAYQINCIAAKEIARQLRLRDLGGVIICDFIDMVEDRHQRGVEQVLAEAMRSDRARSRALRMSRFGIIEMTRQRLRPSLQKSVYHNCPTCGGGGMVKTPESVCLEAMRLLAVAIHKDSVKTIEVYTGTAAAEFLNNKRRLALAEMEERSGKRIVVKINDRLGAGQLEIRCFDSRGIEVRFDADEFMVDAPVELTVISGSDTDRDDREVYEPPAAARLSQARYDEPSFDELEPPLEHRGRRDPYDADFDDGELGRPKTRSAGTAERVTAKTDPDDSDEEPLDAIAVGAESGEPPEERRGRRRRRRRGRRRKDGQEDTLTSGEGELDGDSAEGVSEAETETSDAETSDAETSDAETSDAETSDAETSDAETSDAETSDADLTDFEPADALPPNKKAKSDDELDRMPIFGDLGADPDAGFTPNKRHRRPEPTPRRSAESEDRSLFEPRSPPRPPTGEVIPPDAVDVLFENDIDVRPIPWSAKPEPTTRLPKPPRAKVEFVEEEPDLEFGAGLA